MIFMPSRSSKSRKASLSQSRTLTKITAIKQSADPVSKPITSATTDTSNRGSIATTPSPSTPPQNWPPELPYLTHPIISRFLPPSHTKWLHHRPQDLNLPIITFPLSQPEIQSRVQIRVIDDAGHPACEQRGLFAARDLKPGELVVVYLGYVHGSTAVERAEMEMGRMMPVAEGNGIGKEEGTYDGDVEKLAKLTQVGFEVGEGEVLLSVRSRAQTHPHNTDASAGAGNADEGTNVSEELIIGSWDTSSYDLNMYRSEDIEVAIDAANMGNEARFVNDYRGVPVSLPTTTLVIDSNRERKEKRKVKVKEPIGQGVAAAVGDGEGGDGGEWQASWQYDGGGNIAMPNAEFRDVWFDIQDDVNLSLVSLMEDTLASSSSQLQNRETSRGDQETFPTEVSITSVMENLHLKERQQVETPKDRRDVRSTRRKKRSGVRGVAIFVMPAGKSGKRKHGIKNGQEILVSYGKGFWAHHGADSEPKAESTS